MSQIYTDTANFIYDGKLFQVHGKNDTIVPFNGNTDLMPIPDFEAIAREKLDMRTQILKNSGHSLAEIKANYPDLLNDIKEFIV